MSAATPTYDALKLPEHIKTVLVTGAGGFVGQELVKLLLSLFPDLKIIATDIVEPPSHGVDPSKLVCVKADIGDAAALEELFKGEKVAGVFALHGIMSGGAEANFDLGYAVNLHSHIALLKKTHQHAESEFAASEPRPVYVNASSLAVYGGVTPQSVVNPKVTPVIPESSYGVQKHIIEMLAYDYGRKGYLNTRTVRLPTVVVRPGAPSSAASSYISSLIREPLQNKPTTCPIASSYDDSTLDTYFTWVSRTKTVIRNIAYAMCFPESGWNGVLGRVINLPGIQITPRQIIDALAEHGGQDLVKLISYEKDERVIKICDTWAGAFDNSSYTAMGFEADDPKTGFGSAVADFKAMLQ
ncbi:hypothetical protein IAU60_004319 [Kwoniella sp. DSM 27419]